MFRLACLGLCGAALVLANQTDELIQRVERHYNSAQTLSVGFIESYSMLGRQRQPESGTLTLRKVGKMRWDYAEPSGKLFISDGKNVFLFTAGDNRVEKWKLKDTEDLRAPLAFLLGRMDLRKEFTDFQSRAGVDGEWLAAAAKKVKTPYESVEMLISPGAEIRELKIIGRDGSVLSYRFEGERLNVPARDSEFQFTIPPGAQVIDSVSAMGQGS